MKVVGRNLLYLFWALPWMLAGFICVLTIFGIPVGLALWSIGVAPFERQTKREAKAIHDYVYGQIADHEDVWRPLTAEDYQKVIDATPRVSYIDHNRTMPYLPIDYSIVGEEQEL